MPPDESVITSNDMQMLDQPFLQKQNKAEFENALAQYLNEAATLMPNQKCVAVQSPRADDLISHI